MNNEFEKNLEVQLKVDTDKSSYAMAIGGRFAEWAYKYRQAEIDQLKTELAEEKAKVSELVEALEHISIGKYLVDQKSATLVARKALAKHRGEK